MTSPLESLVAGLGEQLGLAELALDESGSASVAVDEIVVNFESDDSGRTLVMFADVGSAPRAEETSREFYETLLRANFLHLGTGGATLGMDRDAGFVALVDRIDAAGLTPADLAERLERFVNHAEAWTARIAELASAGPESSGDAGLAAGGGLRI